MTNLIDSISSKIKQILERYLLSLSNESADKLSNFITVLKRKINGRFAFTFSGRQLVRMLDFIIVRTNGNRFIEFELSNICNARCIFCPYPDMLRTDKKFMHMDRMVLDDVKTALTRFKGSLISFTPTTGDTLLHPEWANFIREILETDTVGRATMFTNAIELDEDAVENMIHLLKSRNGWKFSQIYFSLGAYDADTYKALYQVDRFEKVRKNIDGFLHRLKDEKIAMGVHFHVKLTHSDQVDVAKAEEVYNRGQYPFVYVSHSKLYFSNDAYKRNAMIDYLPTNGEDMSKPCAYLDKTRFAADGKIWADGCVISEMPGDDSLVLGNLKDDFAIIEHKRNLIKELWAEKGVLPKPCQGCSMYRPCK